MHIYVKDTVVCTLVHKTIASPSTEANSHERNELRESSTE